MLGQECDEGCDGQRVTRRQNAPGDGVGEQEDPRTQQNGKEPQRVQITVSQRVNRRGQRVVKRRLMELVADRGNAQIGRELA